MHYLIQFFYINGFCNEGHPDRQLRLWKRGHARWGGINPHDHLQVSGRIGRLKSNLLHYTGESLDKMIAKITPYSQAFVQHFHESGKRPSILNLGFRPFYRFFRGYILKLGFLDGWQGYFIAWIAGFTAAVRYSKTFIPPKSDKKDTLS